MSDYMDFLRCLSLVLGEPHRLTRLKLGKVSQRRFPESFGAVTDFQTKLEQSLFTSLVDIFRKMPTIVKFFIFVENLTCFILKSCLIKSEMKQNLRRIMLHSWYYTNYFSLLYRILRYL